MKNRLDGDRIESYVSEDFEPIDFPSSAVNDFFPCWGIILGKTSWKQAEDMGYPIIEFPDCPKNIIGGSFSFGSNKGESVLTILSMNNSCDPLPLKWGEKGFSWENSYDKWMKIFRNLGYKITVTHQPSQEFIDMETGEILEKSVLYGKFEALSPDKTLLFEMTFNGGEEGDKTSSPWTLRRIRLEYKEVHPQAEQSRGEHIDYKNQEEKYEIKDSPEGGKHVSMDVILPEEDDEDFDFCTYECRISDKKQIDIIQKHMKRYEQGKEPRAFFMIGRPCLGLDNLDIFYSLDGEIIFNFIFDDKIKSWIREAGFVLGKVKSYNRDVFFPEELAITLSVSKRKGGETLFQQVSEEAMDYIEEEIKSTAKGVVEEKIKKAVKKYMAGNSASPYKVLIIPQYGMGKCTTLDGEEIGTMLDDEIIEMAEKNRGLFGHITSVDYNENDKYDYGVWFTIRVSRSIPRLTLEKEE